MKNTRLIACSAAFFTALSAFGGPGPRCRISIDIGKTDGWRFTADSVPFYNDMKAVQTLVFTGPRPDTIVMRVENSTMLDYASPSFYFPELSVSAVLAGSETVRLDCRLEGDELSFVLPDSVHAVEIAYKYVNDYFMKCGPANPCYAYLMPYNGGWHSWYFTAPGMETESITVNFPDAYYLFAGCPAVSIGDTYTLDPSQSDGPLCFYTVDKAYYDTAETVVGDVSARLYLFREAAFSEDSTAIAPSDGKRDTARCTERFRKAVTGICDLMPSVGPLTVHVVDASLRVGKVSWGSTTRMGDREYLVLIDTAAWNGGALTHELLHVMDGGVLGSIPESDSAHYFFSESLIEYLAVCMDNPLPESRDSVFGRKLASCSDLSGSVFGLTDNRRSGEDGHGSGSIIYDRTPYIIHDFAVETGEKRFMDIFRDFYREARSTGEVSLASLKRHALGHGVAAEKWDAFMRSL